jgi:chromosomal replication initiation ATPase DnaA
MKRGRKKRPLVTFHDSFTKITSRVREYYHVDFLDVDSRKRDVAFARQVAMYMMMVFTDTPIKDIAKLVLDTEDHGSVIYANKQIRAFCRQYPDIRKQIIDIETMLE